jgi:hypothetical protein
MVLYSQELGNVLPKNQCWVILFRWVCDETTEGKKDKEIV